MATRYKEIWFGGSFGISAWVLDAVLCASGQYQWGWASFIECLIESDSPRLLLRILFLISSCALGYSLWQSRERKQRMQELQQVINCLQRQVVNSSLLIAGYSSSVSLKEGWPASRESIEMISAIHLHAQKINEALMQWPVFDLGPRDQIQESEYSTPAEITSAKLICRLANR